MRKLWTLIVALLIARGVFSQATVAENAPKHVHSAPYRRLIEPLLTVPDFHMHYFEDGASDATVTCPNDCNVPPEPPVPEVAALMKSLRITVPLLISCLDDGRITSVRFDGNTTTRPMQVPIGYVCLDILMAKFFNEPVAEYECNSDGLGACMHTGFYFRPDDYYLCIAKSCEPRPWVRVVKQNWQRALQSGRLWKAQKGGPESEL